MIDHLPLESIFTTALQRGGDLAEIFAESSQRTIIVCDDDRLETVATSNDAGIGLRVVHDARTAFGSINDIAPAAIGELAHTLALTVQSGEHRPVTRHGGAAKEHTHHYIKHHPAGMQLDKKASLVRRANRLARAADKRIVQVKVVLRDHVRQIRIASSDGTTAADEQTYVTFLVQAVGADGSILQTAYEPVGGMKGYEILDEITPEEIAAAATRRVLLMLDAAPAPTGPMCVVLAGEAGGTMIHEAVGHGLEADLAQEGLSVYKNSLGTNVASSLISVYDDATLPGKRGSFVTDDEGTPAQKTCLIEQGVLKTYLHNRISATKHGGMPTGNGRRQSYAHMPIVRMTNTYIAAGCDKPDDIIRATERGLYVKKIGGGQVNTVNGDFVFYVQEGYRIEHGKVGEPVRGATLTGNGPVVLATIDRVADDVGFAIGTCGKHGQEIPVSSGQPTLRIPEIIVGGTG